MDNLSLPFQLESHASRGRLVRLGTTVDEILHRHDYPERVAKLLGEVMVTAVALATALKYDGVFTLQARSKGAVRLLVADVTGDGAIRAYAQYDAEKVAVPETVLLEEGYLAFTVSHQKQDEKYQGMVSLEGNTIAEAVQHYFRQSEQIPTGLIAAVDRDEEGRWRGGCLMLQRMPRDGGKDAPTDTGIEDDWHRAMMLMETCTAEELTDPTLSAENLLFRLFHEEGVRVYDPRLLVHRCRCSQERVTDMLRNMPRTEVEAMVVDGRVTVTCEFCNRSYVYDQNDLEALWN